MKTLLLFFVLTLFCGCTIARYKRTTTTTTKDPYPRRTTRKPTKPPRTKPTTKKPDPAVRERYEELLESWRNPPPSLKKKISLTTKEFAYWVSLKMFVPKGEGVRPTNVLRFCGCKKRSLDSIVKRAVHKSQSKKRKQPKVPVMRKEWRTMSRKMRDSFIEHFNKLTVKGPNGTSELDKLAGWHRESESPGAHGGPAFLPWHREFLFRLDNALRNVNYTYGLPYWNSGLEGNLPNPAHSAIFTEKELGVSNGRLGKPFDPILVSQDCVDAGFVQHVERHAENPGELEIFSRETYESLRWEEPYYKFSENLEYEHGGVHHFFGNAHMLNLSCTGYEPLFYLHHTYIDCVWQDYRNKQGPKKAETDYPVDKDVPNGHRKYQNMKPFDMEVIDGMATQKTSVFYQCDKSPGDCRDDAACRSELLFCNDNFCQAKIRLGGECNPDHPGRQCYCKKDEPACISNRCRCIPKRR